MIIKSQLACVFTSNTEIEKKLYFSWLSVYLYISFIFFSRSYVVWSRCFAARAALTFDGASCQALSWIKGSIRQTCVLSTFVMVGLFLSEWNIIFISLHSEWQFLKIAPHWGIFITFCRPAWVARQLFIFLHLSSISLSQKASFFSCQFSCFTLQWPSCLNCLACVIHSLRFTENNIVPQDFPYF